MNRKVFRCGAYSAVALFTFEGVPHFPQTCDDGAGGAAFNLCSASEDRWAIEPQNQHIPHREFETSVHSGFRFLASGVSSTTTGPVYRITAAAEDVARWPGRDGGRIQFLFEP